MRPDRLRAAGALAVVYVVWGSTYLVIRVMVRDVPPLLGAGARFVLAGALLLAWVRIGHGIGRSSGRVTRGELGAAALVGTLLAFGGNGLVTVAEQNVPSGLAALIIASVPLWVVVLRAAFRERPARATLLGVGAGFAGVGVLLLPGQRPSGVGIGPLLLVVLAAASWASGSFAGSRLATAADPLRFTGLQMLLGGLVMSASGLASWFPSKATPRKPRPAAAASRTRAACSPTPPVNASASIPPIAATIAAISARSRCT